MCESNEGGIRTTAMLRGEGRTRRDIAADVGTASLVAVRRGVYAMRGSCDAVLAAAAHGGSVGCVSAARHLGLWVLDQGDSPHVWMRRGGHRYPHGRKEDCGCLEHWDDDRAPESFALPPVPRILRQILFCRGLEEFFVVLESALRLRLIDDEGMGWLRSHTNAAAREAIAMARNDAESGLESLIRWRLRRFGLTVRTQVRIPATGRVDLLIGERLIVEADGALNHDDGEHRHKDLRRDANAAMWGYVTIRFDYALIVHDWDLVERAIMAHVAAGRHR